MNICSVAQAKRFRKELGATHVIIYAVAEDHSTAVATHGKTEADAKVAAEWGNKLKAAIGWPEHLCKDKPLERQCNNCTYFKRDYGSHCFAGGWTKDGSTGDCLLEPTPIRNKAKGDKCCHFEPRP